MRRSPTRELMDDPGLDRAESDRALADLERVNRWLLGLVPVRRTLLPRLVGGPRRQRLLDVGTGTGQASAALARAAGERGVQLESIGVDRKLGHLLAGRERGFAQRRVVADAGALPFADGAVDWSLSTLFFHHFDAAANRRIVAEMRRVARRGVAVVDLRRSRLARWLIRLALPLLGAGRVAEHDGPASVASAWTVDEVRRWLDGWQTGRRGGEPAVELRRRFPFRLSLVLGAAAAAQPAESGPRAGALPDGRQVPTTTAKREGSRRPVSLATQGSSA